MALLNKKFGLDHRIPTTKGIRVPGSEATSLPSQKVVGIRSKASRPRKASGQKQGKGSEESKWARAHAVRVQVP